MSNVQVVKIGSGCVISDKKEYERVSRVCYEITRMKYEEGIDTAMVISGAVRFGIWEEVQKGLRPAEDLVRKIRNVKELQCLARIGQTQLMTFYAECFGMGYERYIAKSGKRNNGVLITTQVLATYHNLEDEKEKSKTMEAILADAIAAHTVPLYNYNDGIDSSEVRRDNDKPAAEIAVAINASRLIMLGAGVGGLEDANHDIIHFVSEITQDIESLCKDPSAEGTGGAMAKLEAVKILRSSDKRIPMYWGHINDGLEGALAGNGTIFHA